MFQGVFILIILVAFIFLFVFSIRMALLTSKNRKKHRSELNSKIKDLNAKEYGVFQHTIGLPLAENVFCNLYFCEDKLTIESGGAVFNLSLNKIKDMTCTTDVEIQKAYVSSAGGAVAGAMLFGPLGAMVGGRAKEKNTRDITVYLVISYEKNDNLEYISLKASNSLKVNKFINLFKQTSQNKKIEIEL